MNKETWTLREVRELFEVGEDFLSLLEEERILCPTCQGEPPDKFFSATDLETLHLTKTLVEDLGVNLAGVEVVLQMRKNMIEMRRQFDDILEDLARQMEEAFRRVAGP